MPAFAGAALAAAFACFPHAANATDRTVRTQVAVLTPGSITKVADMDFGKIAQANNPGTVVISPSSTPTCAVTGGLIRSGACQAAHFAIMGRKNDKARIRENNGGQVTLTGPGGATMSMNNITIGAPAMTASPGANGWDLGNWRINTNNGITDFYIGGTLNVGAAQAAGVYHGTLIIQIQFN